MSSTNDIPYDDEPAYNSSDVSPGEYSSGVEFDTPIGTFKHGVKKSGQIGKEALVLSRHAVVTVGIICLTLIARAWLD